MKAAILLSLLLLAACGSRDKSAGPATVPPEPMRPGSLQLPADAGMVAGELEVVSILGEAVPDSSGHFDVAMAESDKPQFVAAMDPDTGNPLLLGYSDPARGDSVDVSLESTALALVFLNPLMFGTTAEQRSGFISDIKAHPAFPLLVEDLEARFQADPQNALDFDSYPELYQQAVEILLDIWQQVDAAGKLAQDDLSVPWLEDEAGNDIAFVNPTMVYYGAGLSKNQQLEEVVTAQPKAKYFDVSWEGWGDLEGWSRFNPLNWFSYRTPPETTRHRLTYDGEIEAYLTKGYRFENLDEFFNWHSPTGRATILNTTTIFIFAIDILVSLPVQVPRTSLKLNKEGKLAVDSMRAAFRAGKTHDFLLALIGLLKSNFTQIIKWLGGLDSDAAKRPEFIAKRDNFLKVGTSVAESLAKVLQAIDAVNVKIPFVTDLLTAEPEVLYTFRHADGQVTNLAKNTPPVPAFVISPPAGVVGTEFIVDASPSWDEEGNLVYRWDWENDGLWDTGWQDEEWTVHSFDEPGSYTVVLQVRDEAQSTRVITRQVSVGGGRGTANHIKLFRDALPWDSNAMVVLFDALGFVEGTGAGAYEILTSREMRSVELIPGQDLVVISNDQPQGFYDNYARNQVKFLNFVDNGGTLFWGASDEGWKEGSIAEAGINLPGSVEVHQQYESVNLVFDPSRDLPLVSGLPASLDGNYASHEWFANLPDGTVIYTTGIDSGQPTLIEFNWGAGWVIMTGQPLEWSYDRRDDYSMGLLLDRVIVYVLGAEGQAGKIAAMNLPRPVVDRDRPSSEIR